ncbi:MAG: hypothetical protein AAB966_04870 [Patescibacteria group bacterium]
MESFNKTLSFVLGLVVVVVFIVVATRGFSSGKNLLPFLQTTNSSKPTITKTKPPTSTKTPTQSSPTPTKVQTQTKPKPQQIPKTGVSIVFFPTLISVFATGVYLRKKS